MADEKKPSGGLFEGYDPLVLIIGGLLAFALLTNLLGREQYQPLATKESSNSEELWNISGYEQSCGLFVISPKPLEKVSGSVILEGTVGSCEWLPVGTVALYAQVVDTAGTLVSGYTTIQIENSYGASNLPILETTTRPFSQNIALTVTPKTKTGFLILVHPDRNRPTTKTVRIPIRFQ